MNATILLWNPPPPIVEAVTIRDGLALHGIEADMPLAESEDDDDVHILTQEEEFLTLYPRKDLKELNETEEDGVFTVVARVTSLAEGEKWWYSACSCHKAVTTEDGTFYCSGCRKPLLSVTPRLKLKVEVEDAFDCGTFVIFGTDCQLLLNKSCKELVMISKAKSPYEYPAEIETIIGRELLFKAEKSIGHGTKFDDSYKVKKICS
ncbi:uncharacterized protein LOC130726638 [Lotus japonicus]|uniref:uncharacterized protein LOC130726638 n=1 Tax=Lotus japonicus TaxID=34305 RepID=UPI0025873C28|nr:uncharacterized protein LOC130726638 [Lotus japonicus]